MEFNYSGCRHQADLSNRIGPFSRPMPSVAFESFELRGLLLLTNQQDVEHREKRIPKESAPSLFPFESQIDP